MENSDPANQNTFILCQNGKSNRIRKTFNKILLLSIVIFTKVDAQSGINIPDGWDINQIKSNK